MKRRLIAVLLCVSLLCGCSGAEESLPDENTPVQENGIVLLEPADTEQSVTSSEAEVLPETTAETATVQTNEESAETSENAPNEQDKQTVETETSEESASQESESVKPAEETNKQDNSAPSNETAYEYTRSDLDVLLKQAADSSYVTGLSVALFDQSGIVHTYNTGYADKENGVLCDDDTVYRVASVSKFVAALSLMTLYDKGELTPDSDLAELTGLPFKGNTPVKLWNLLTHTAGIGDTAAYQSAVNYKYGIKGGVYTPIEELLPNSSTGSVGAAYSYTNFGAGVMGAVIERVSGEYFCEYAYANLFAPMGLNAGYAIDQISDRSRIANVYLGGELNYTPKHSFRDCEYYRGYELGESYFTANTELLISCPDLARIGMMISGDGSFNGKHILSPEAVKLVNSVWYKTGGSFDMGLCTRIYDGNIVEGRTIYGHPGQALGNVCGLYYDPSDGTGVAICTSGSSSGTADNGVYSILNNCIKAAYNCWFDNMNE